MLDELRKKVNLEQFELSAHALSRSLSRHILLGEIIEALLVGEVIEVYPEDRYGPSCLILGYTKNERHLHIQCSYPSRPILKIITVYEPEPDKWTADFKNRKQ